jgi:soluble P-type ATPase
MLEIVIPGDRTLGLQHLVLDYNGTLACDGELLAGVKPRLDDLSRHLDIHVLTADTFGKARTALAGSITKVCSPHFGTSPRKWA